MRCVPPGRATGGVPGLFRSPATPPDSERAPQHEASHRHGGAREADTEVVVQRDPVRPESVRQPQAGERGERQQEGGKDSHGAIVPAPGRATPSCGRLGQHREREWGRKPRPVRNPRPADGPARYHPRRDAAPPPVHPLLGPFATGVHRNQRAVGAELLGVGRAATHPCGGHRAGDGGADERSIVRRRRGVCALADSHLPAGPYPTRGGGICAVGHARGGRPDVGGDPSAVPPESAVGLQRTAARVAPMCVGVTVARSCAD